MEPTLFDTILACIYAIPVLAILIAMFLPWNEHYDPKSEDPYRYCSKEDEQ